jgi:PhnB protein
VSLTVQLLTMTQPKTSLAPWLTVPDGENAVAFYKSAFGATEAYRLDMPPEAGTVVRLSVHGAEFWVSSEAATEPQSSQQPVGGGTVRMILTVADPDAVFAQALSAGATEVFPVGEEHGWRLGRLIDPFGLHWEIGKPL